ncbi:hypothetical protein [Dongia rigui]|uniref:Uncharacterized protein n=1 Tax=Dongia rigui TaxID=940149 RepID=A0ABU5DSJ5_9PROT|nr:hypothetical protein [Dongia rigui]MDY0870370.1 hypothetical protein [Dongia rigui]
MSDNSANAASQIGIKTWMIIVPIVLIALIFMPSAVVVGAGMIPTVVARVVDTSPGKRLSITVGGFNLIGCLYFLHLIWAAGHGMGDIRPTLGDSYGWLCALVGAGVGWVVFGFMPAVVGKIADTQTALRLRSLTKDQDRLVEEWGEAVRGAYGVQEVPKVEDED